MSHTKKILGILKTGQPVTIAGLNRELNFECNHPITIIFELRKQGHSIVDKWVKTVDGKRYKQYWLKYGA